MERTLCYLSDERLDELLSKALNVMIRRMQRHNHHWRCIEEFFSTPPAVWMLIREYGERHHRPKVQERKR